MATLKDISGTFDATALEKLVWPIAWSGAPDLEYEAALSRLVRAAREALSECLDGVAVEVEAGEIVAVCQ